jgi:pyrimidine-nucleoside phosphorylase
VGRATKSDSIDPAVGLMLRVAPGAHVRRGDALVEIHSREAPPVDLLDALRAAFSLGESAPALTPLILDTIR